MSLEENTSHIDLIIEGLSFPTSVTMADDGTLFVAESGLPFAGAPPGGRIWRLDEQRRRTLVLEDLHPPVNGLTFHNNSLFISEGGHPARISRFDLRDDRQFVILDQLPGPGNYHTNMVAFGPDGKLYFSQGAMTNTGIIGLDAFELGWLRRLPHSHDLPGYDVVLTGVNVESSNPLNGEVSACTQTGAFVPFGTQTEPNQRIPAQLPCTAAILRCNSDGSDLELVSWGLRNAYGIGFLTDGRLLAIDQGADDRGSRPVGQAPDLLFEVRKGAWYGWPDFIDGIPVSDVRYQPQRGPSPSFLLANHAELPMPEKALLSFPPHTAAVKFDVAREGTTGWAGQIFVALFGDEVPMTAPSGPKVGRSVVRVDPVDWSLHPFIKGPLRRPIDVRFSQAGEMYILDFGNFEMEAGGRVKAEAKSGRLWRVQLSDQRN